MREFENRAYANVTASELDVRASELMAFAECSYRMCKRPERPSLLRHVGGAGGKKQEADFVAGIFPAMMKGTLL